MTGYAETADGGERAFVWTAGGGIKALPTLGGPRSEGLFVTDSGMVIGVSDGKNKKGLHAFVWTEDGGMVEMPSLGHLDYVDGFNQSGAFVGFSSIKKDGDDQHAALWTPTPDKKPGKGTR